MEPTVIFYIFASVDWRKTKLLLKPSLWFSHRSGFSPTLPMDPNVEDYTNQTTVAFFLLNTLCRKFLKINFWLIFNLISCFINCLYVFLRFGGHIFTFIQNFRPPLKYIFRKYSDLKFKYFLASRCTGSCYS